MRPASLLSDRGPVPAALPAAAPPVRRAGLRIIPALERYPRLVTFAQTHVGRALLLGVYAIVVVLHGDSGALLAPLALVVPTFFPARRRAFIALIALPILILRPIGTALDPLLRAHGVPSITLLRGALTPAALLLIAAYAYLVLRRPTSILAERPIVSVLSLFVLLLIGASFLPASGLAPLIAWSFVIVVSHFLWFLCYTVKNRAPRSLRELCVEIGHYGPFWYPDAGTGGTPVPKPGSFLDRIEAKTPEELAVCQLKGIKLTCWALGLAGLAEALSWAAYGSPSLTPSLSLSLVGPSGLGIPRFEDAMSLSAAARPLSMPMSWLSLGAHFFIKKLLPLTVGLHFAVGLCRMAGFRALRGVYRPFDARSFADFWNRVHYYFKELMVEVFFYPVYFSVFRRHPRLRAVTATFAAAFVGNLFYHVLRDLDWIVVHGLAAARVKWEPYALYAFLLALGISISQLRSTQRARARDGDSTLARVAVSAAVILSYCLLGILDEAGDASLASRARFFLQLFAWTGAPFA